jgi:hypothetical protein
MTHRVALLVYLGALLLMLGCSSPIVTATRATNAAAVSLTEAHAQLLDHRRQAQVEAARRVPGDRSDASVRAEQLDRARLVGQRYRGAWKAYSAARAAWLVAVAGIKIARETEAVGGAAALAALGPRLAVLAAAQADALAAIHEITGLLGSSPPPAPE